MPRSLVLQACCIPPRLCALCVSSRCPHMRHALSRSPLCSSPRSVSCPHVSVFPPVLDKAPFFSSYCPFILRDFLRLLPFVVLSTTLICCFSLSSILFLFSLFFSNSSRYFLSKVCELFHRLSLAFFYQKICPVCVNKPASEQTEYWTPASCFAQILL